MSDEVQIDLWEFAFKVTGQSTSPIPSRVKIYIKRIALSIDKYVRVDSIINLRDVVDPSWSTLSNIPAQVRIAYKIWLISEPYQSPVC